MDLESQDDAGLGWCNSQTNGAYLISEPLYDGLNELPVYAGLDSYVEVQDLVDYNNVPRPPILNTIMQCLTDAMRGKSKADAILALLSYIAPRWVQFFLNLNRFIVLYGETAFRLTDDTRMMMEEVVGQGGLVEAMNSPVHLKVRADSIYKFMLRLPEVFTPQMRVLRQPIAESATGAELQRIVSMYVCIDNWIQADNVREAYTARRCLRLVVESIESNHIAKKIFNYCFSGGDIQRFDPASLNALIPLFDDFEAHFFNDVYIFFFFLQF